MRLYERGQPSPRTGNFRHVLRVWFATGTLIALSACGGGGGGGSPPPANPPANPPVTPPVTPPPAANQAPTVTLGDDQTIQLPTNSVSLTGSASDPENAPLTYAWTSSPADGVTFSAATAASTTVTFPGEGTYTLTLTANDGQATGSDSLVVTVQPAASAEVFWPAPDTDETVADRGWIRVTPAEAGMDLARLEQAATYALTAGGSGMVVKGGRLVHSWGDIDERFASQSATKSIGGTLLGLAIDDGLVNLTDTAASRISYIGNPPGTDDSARLGAITVLQLATHTSGFPKNGGYQPLQFDPGTTWQYSDGGLNWLADLLTNVFQQDLQTVIAAKVWTDLGINNGNTDDVLWRANDLRPTPPPGAPAIAHRELASGMSINANAMSRVGLLYLRNGEWSTRRILSEDFVTDVRTPLPEVASLPNADAAEYPAAPANYGMLWWTNANGDMPDVPTDAYWAWGQYDSLIVVIPSLDLVISRIGPPRGNLAGRVFGDGDWTADYAVLEPFLEPIVCAADPASTACN